MADDVGSRHTVSAGTLLTGFLGDLQLLFEQQFQLTRCEIEQEFRQRATAVGFLAAGAVTCSLSGLMMCLSAAHWLHFSLQKTAAADSTSLPLWACYGIVGVVIGFAAILLLWLGRRQIRRISVSENPAVEIWEEFRNWKTEP
jgi:uncharacterized membrane protein YidH (DUF202 family)